jgi:serine protease Do
VAGQIIVARGLMRPFTTPSARSTPLNGHIGLIHSILPATVDLQVTIPESHPSARNLGSERVGSGTLVDPDGYILTVHYVTIGAASITVTLADGDQFPAEVAAQDQETGLSLVKIKAQGLPFLKLAHSPIRRTWVKPW